MKGANNVPPADWCKSVPIQARLEAIETVRGMASLSSGILGLFTYNRAFFVDQMLFSSKTRAPACKRPL
jgi:hypothetical protein